MTSVKTWIVAVAAAAVLCAVVGASYLSLPALTAVVCVSAVVIGVGWPVLLEVPAKKTLAVVISLAGIATAVLATVAPAGMPLLWMAVVIALGVMAVFLIQLIRGTGQPHRLESTFGASAGLVLTSLGAGWVAAERLAANTANTGMMLVTGISMLVAIGACLLPWPDRMVAPLGVVLATLAGTLAAPLFSNVPMFPAAVVGAVVGIILVCFRRLILAGGGPTRLPAMLAAGAAPVMSAGSLVYFLERMLLR
jgi:hypothetical protein